MRRNAVRFLVCVLLLAALHTAAAAEPHTGFQSSNVWKPQIDLPADVVFVYSTDAERIKTWADHGFETWVMLGASWLSKETDVVVQHPEIRQAVKDGTPFEMIPGRAWVAPVAPWIEWFKARVDQAMAGGARGILPEEPEFFASTGYSDSFKQAWREYYGQPWRAPHESVENNWRAGQLKAHLFEEFFRQVCAHVKSKDPAVQCVVPVHSNLNYTDWNILAPHHAFLALDHTDGFIAQVWTGTAKHAHMLGGEPFADTFFYAYLEYSYFAELVRGTSKQAWFLTDPVEDAEGASWADLRSWYEGTLAAALLHPPVNRYEIAPWPTRIFMTTDLYGDSPIPETYASELFTVWQAQRQIPETGRWLEPVTWGIGFLTADTAMWQNGLGMNRFSGHAAPMLAAVRAGIPARVLPAERFAEPGWPPEDVKVIVASFDAWKPADPEIVRGMAHWVKDGGALLFLGGADAYDHMPSAWWREQGMDTPALALLNELGTQAPRCKSWMPTTYVEGFETAAFLAGQLRTLSLSDQAPPGLRALGDIQATLPITACAAQDARVFYAIKGKPVVWETPAGAGRLIYAGFPGEFVAAKQQGADAFLALLQYAAENAGLQWRTPAAWLLERGPFVMGRCLSGPCAVQGNFSDLLQPGAPQTADPSLANNQNVFLRKIDY